MKIQFNIKPRTFKADTIDALKSKIRNNYRNSGLAFSRHFSGYYYGHDDKNIILYNIQKHRPIKKQLKSTYIGDRGLPIRKTDIIQRGYVVAYVYIIPHNVLKALNLYADQGARTFKIKNLK